MQLNSTIKLNNGVEIPILGLGTWQSQGSDAKNAVIAALEQGYRHIDTALIYGNEDEVGKGLKKYLKKNEINREEIFVTTKLWNDSHGYDKTLKAIDVSLKNLDLKYVDLYLIHWPVPGKRLETWKAMEKILKEGKARAIGVSNFMIHHLETFLPNIDIIPAVNQIEFTPYLYLKELKNICDENKIVIEAYTPLTQGKKFSDPALKEIALKYNKTPAQILLRWGLQHGIVELPKSVHKKWIIENSQVFDFEITTEDMNVLDNFNQDWRCMQDPDWTPMANRWRE